MSDVFMCGCTANRSERTFHFCSREHEDKWRNKTRAQTETIAELRAQLSAVERELEAALKIIVAGGSDASGVNIVTAAHLVVGDMHSAESGRDFWKATAEQAESAHAGVRELLAASEARAQALEAERDEARNAAEKAQTNHRAAFEDCKALRQALALEQAGSAGLRAAVEEAIYGLANAAVLLETVPTWRDIAIKIADGLRPSLSTSAGKSALEAMRLAREALIQAVLMRLGELNDDEFKAAVRLNDDALAALEKFGGGGEHG